SSSGTDAATVARAANSLFVSDACLAVPAVPSVSIASVHATRVTSPGERAARRRRHRRMRFANGTPSTHRSRAATAAMADALGPRVGLLAGDVVEAVGLQLAGREANGDAGWDPERPGHRRVRAGELLAVALP